MAGTIAIVPWPLRWADPLAEAGEAVDHVLYGGSNDEWDELYFCQPSRKKMVSTDAGDVRCVGLWWDLRSASDQGPSVELRQEWAEVEIPWAGFTVATPALKYKTAAKAALKIKIPYYTNEDVVSPGHRLFVRV